MRLVQTLDVTGTLASPNQVEMSTAVPERVTRVLVREGERVRAGQLLVAFDSRDAEAGIGQAQAGLAEARAKWLQARGGQPLKVAQARAQVSQSQEGVRMAQARLKQSTVAASMAQGESRSDVRKAQAAVDAARSSLAAARQGARPAQRQAAKAQVRQAQVGLEAAQANLTRMEGLLKTGDVAGVQVEEARTQEATAAAVLDAARANLRELESGASPEELAAAQAQVREAEAGLEDAMAGRGRIAAARGDMVAARTQVATAESALQVARAGLAQIPLARQDTAAAAAGVQQARAALSQAQAALGASRSVAPIAGTIIQMAVRPGDTAQPGQPYLTLAGQGGVLFTALVPERRAGSVAPGQSVTLRPASRSHAYAGVVQAVIPSVEAHAVRVRIAVRDPGRTLLPGAFAQGTIETRVAPDALVIPQESVRSGPTGPSVFVVENGRARERSITLGLQQSDLTQVLRGLKAGWRVILSATPTLRSGDPVEETQTEGRSGGQAFGRSGSVPEPLNP